MAGNDDIVAGAEAPLVETAPSSVEISPDVRAKIAELTDIAAREIGELSRLRTALAERDATIERLTKGVEDLTAANMRLCDHVANWRCEAKTEAARATTAERERDEAKAEVERLRELFRADGEQHAQFVKNLTKAHEDRITKYADAFADFRAEVERKDAALRLIESWEPATQEITVANMMAAEARARRRLV